jgi:hypothetical protein
LGGGCFADNGPYANVPKDPSNRCPCSRAYGRANPPAGIYCPPGTGAGGEVVIGPEGGTLALPGHDSFGGQVSLVVPPGALSQPTKLTMTELPVPTPIGYTDLTPIYDLEPAGLKLAAPAKLVMYWDIYQAAGASLTLSLQGGVYESLTQLGSYALLPGSSTGAGMSFAAIDTLGFVFASYPATLDPAYCLATAGGLQ